MEENKELLELLQKIEKNSRQQATLSKVSCGLALVAAILCGCTLGLVYNLLPQVMDILPQINAVVTQANTVVSQVQIILSNLEETTVQLSAVDFAGMIQDVNTLVSTAQMSLEQTMGQLNTIDFETLNQAIEDLAKVIEPLSKLMNVFG